MWALLALMLVQGPAVKAGPAADACGLIANEDVRRVLAVDVKARQPIAQSERGLLSQCYLETGSARSVSVAVLKNTPDREFEGKRIEGVGDEAYWAGNRVTGALYARRGETLVRVSVGGIRDEQDRIEKSRQLAVAALGRLAR